MEDIRDCCLSMLRRVISSKNTKGNHRRLNDRHTRLHIPAALFKALIEPALKEAVQFRNLSTKDVASEDTIDLAALEKILGEETISKVIDGYKFIVNVKEMRYSHRAQQMTIKYGTVKTEMDEDEDEGSQRVYSGH